MGLNGDAAALGSPSGADVGVSVEEGGLTSA